MFILLTVFVPGIAHAKRTRAPKVEPVVHEGVRYIAPNDDGRRAYVQAWDTKTNKMVWEVTIFRNLINPLKEEDVQWLFIKGMFVDDGKLIVIAEGNRVYSLDLKTRAVKRLKQAPPRKPQANTYQAPGADAVGASCLFLCQWPRGSGAALAAGTHC